MTLNPIQFDSFHPVKPNDEWVYIFLQALKTRVTCEIRALVVLPVQDLATQVYKVFQTYCKGTQLKVHLALNSFIRKKSQIH